MWFKNLQVYRLPANWEMTPDQIAAALLTQTFVELQSFEHVSHGWVPSFEDQLVYTSGRQMLLTLRTDTKLLPASVINATAQERAVVVEQEQGFKPGRKQMKELKEQVTDDLLPVALHTRSFTRLWVDPIHGWLAVDTASPNRADVVLKTLLRSFEKLPLETLYLAKSPLSMMTEWLATDEAPFGFTVDADMELRASGNSNATVRYTKGAPDAEDLRRNIAGGKQCTKLAMTWQDRISFVLNEDLRIRRITPLDVLTENCDGSANAAERFESDFVLMTGELNNLLNDLISAVGGERREEK